MSMWAFLGGGVNRLIQQRDNAELALYEEGKEIDSFERLCLPRKLRISPREQRTLCHARVLLLK